MIARALDAGTPAAWVTGDEVYGGDPGLRADLERRQIGYVLAVAASHRVTTSAGACLLAATLSAHESAAFDVHVTAGLGGAGR
jgi:SRSO17 transposase